MKPILALALLALGCHAPIVQENEEYRWFESGWYVGGTGGVAITDASGADLDERLAEEGFPSTSSTLDDHDSAWKAYLGYRFERRFGFEVGYANLGQVSSRVDTAAIDPDVLLDALADTQPFLGRGPTAAGLVYLLDTKLVDVGVRGGAWLWEADVEARTSNGDKVSIDEDGIDPFYGVFLLLEINDRAALRAEYERYELEGDGADFLSVGLQIRVD